MIFNVGLSYFLIANWILDPAKNGELKSIIYNLIFVMLFLCVIMACMMIVILMKQYNSFTLWMGNQKEELIKKLNKISKRDNSFNDFFESRKERVKLNRMLVFPWAILCLYSPQWLQFPMYLLYRNWKKISNLENDLLLEVAKVKGIQKQKLKPIIFLTKDIWFWAIFFNLSFSIIIAPIWIFFYLRKVKYLIRDVKTNLNLIK